jgi:hypothetical protein
MLSAIAVIFALLDWVFSAFKLPHSPWVTSAVAVLLCAVSLFKVRKALPQYRQYKLGLKGEQIVGQILETLRADGYRVFHDLQGDGFNVDHVLVGPAGLFAIETKTATKPTKGDARITIDGDTVRVAGHRPDRDPVAQAEAAASFVHERIKATTGRDVRVRPVVLYPEWFVDGKQSSGGTWVLNPKALPSFIRNEPVTLAKEDIHLFVDRLEIESRQGGA